MCTSERTREREKEYRQAHACLIVLFSFILLSLHIHIYCPSYAVTDRSNISSSSLSTIGRSNEMYIKYVHGEYRRLVNEHEDDRNSLGSSMDYDI